MSTDPRDKSNDPPTLSLAAQSVECAEPPGSYLIIAARAEAPASFTPARFALDGITEVRLTRDHDAQPYREQRVDSVLTIGINDPWLSKSHAKLVLEADYWLLEDCGSKNGTLVAGAAIQTHQLRNCDTFELGRAFLKFRDDLAPNRAMHFLESAPATCMQTALPELAVEFLRATEVAAATEIPMLITGETGTGKELVAGAIHQLSRCRGQLVAVNCAALAPTMLESELFGHKRGAFTGATADRAGLVASAQGGTLFLDEIGELSASAQAALLRALQEKLVRPVGSDTDVSVDFRLVAATHRDLEAEIDAGRFREDLYARLAGFELHLPPLRDRMEDIGLLIRALLDQMGRGKLTFTPEALRALFAYSWPRNIRELKNALTSAAALGESEVVSLEDLPRAVAVPPPRQQAATPDNPASPTDRRASLIAVLRHNGGNVSAAARTLGTTRAQIHRWSKRYELDLDSFRVGPQDQPDRDD